MDYSKLRAATVAALMALAGSSCGVIDNLNNPDDLSVRRFSATPTEVSRGTTVTLSWDVDGAESVQIDNGIGTVKEQGSRTVRIDGTTTFVLMARKGTSSAQSSIQVAVIGTGMGPSPSPLPSASPSATPSPSPTPTPTPSPSPTDMPAPSPSVSPGPGKPSPSPSPSAAPRPSPSASPKPSPSPSPTPLTCGQTATTAGSCALTITYPTPLDRGCLAINSVTFSSGCPASLGIKRQMTFTVTSRSAAVGDLEWRQGAGSTNLLLPDGGALSDAGPTTVTVDELVLDNRSVIEIVTGDAVLATLTVRSR